MKNELNNIYNFRFQTLSKKFGHEATNILLIFDACGIKNWSGPGYRCPFKKNKSESPNNSYYIMLKYPDVRTSFIIVVVIYITLD